MTAGDKYSLDNSKNLAELIQRQVSKILKTFCPFFSPFLKSTWSFQEFGKKMTLIAYVFPKLQTVKDMIEQMFK